MASKDELKKRMQSLQFKVALVMNMLPGEARKQINKQVGDRVEKHKNGIIQALAALAVPFIIFFPFNLEGFLIPLVVALVIVIVVSIVAEFASSLPIGDVLWCIALILIAIVVTQFINCGSQACFWVVSTRIGTNMTIVVFLAFEIICAVIGATTSRGVFFVSMIVILILLFALIPFLSPARYYSICKGIPGLSGSEWCKSREVSVESLKTVNIPVSGGIGVKIETPGTLYGGDPYEYTFTLTNYYGRDINFKITPSIVSSYGSNIEFVQPYTQKIDSLKPNEYYQDSISLNPDEMTMEEGTCPYSTQQIAAAQYIHLENVTCSADKPCENSKEVCAKLDTFECGCVDWAKATCSGNSLRAKVSVEHSAFFLGNASLYYSNDITSPAYGSELTQGPLSVVVEFQPNPYIASIDQNRDTVSMYVTFKNHGGDIDIKSFKVTPQDTVIKTIDNENQMELTEEVGTEVVSCRDISEILPQTLSSGAEVGGKLCDLKPPSVKTTLIDLKDNSTTEVNDVTYPFLANYCSKTKVNGSEGTSWSTNWDKIYSAIDTSGMCQILNEQNSGDKQIVQDAMAHVNVLVEFEYNRKIDFYSDEVVPYTRTDKCCELIQKNGGSCWATSTT